jgi:hypothetical protein
MNRVMARITQTELVFIGFLLLNATHRAACRSNPGDSIRKAKDMAFPLETTCIFSNLEIQNPMDC